MGVMDENIPIVSIDDLRTFHEGHFSTDFTGPNLCSDTTTHEHVDASLQAEEEGGDALGYYADGFPRTLTDDQIAMFRYSEIQSLRRERKQQQEATIQDLLNSAIDKKKAEMNKQTATQPRGPERKQTQSGPSQRGSSGKHPGKPSDRGLSWNRMARELDNAKEEVVELDY
ncbi:MAG: hypothetical protein M1831_000921 [Alyxoria varia]|nr:MAG: hypothetical protein M1831_000921 [Alyxoria varia]